MNVDCNSYTNENKVISKYFTKESMDESLCDFQDSKQSHRGPKSLKTNTRKSRKPAKRPRGQKDIRTALKSKKSDLITYTENFDAACKKSGIDVDTEELQLAIALSKSLQTEASKDHDHKELSTQQSIKKIRTTLQEYGFKVPDAKIITNRKGRQKKHYRLTTDSKAQKEQIIADKYSQVLLTNINEFNSFDCLEGDNTSLFYKSTNIPYKDIRCRKLFYCIELVDQSTSNGCIFRDWTKIPGRPSSPQALSKIEMNFSEIECSQEELDLALSGLLTQSKKILSLKQIEKENFNINPNKHLDNNVNNDLSSDNNTPNIIVETGELSEKNVNDNRKINHESKHRSCSPDIFDDEESIIEGVATDTTVQEKTSYIMDLTECVNNVPLKNNTFANSYNTLSQKNNPEVTRRKSNDYMEITECVASTSKTIDVNGDLIQVPENKEMITTEKHDDTFDLTQLSDSGDDLPEVYFSSNKNLDDTVPLSDCDYGGVVSKDLNLNNKDYSDVLYDLTQDNSLKISPDKYSADDNKDPKGDKNSEVNIPITLEPTEKVKETENEMFSNQLANTTHKSSIVVNIAEKNTNGDVNDENITENNQNINVSKCPINNSMKYQICENISGTGLNNDLPNDNIDLTQSSDNSEETENETTRKNNQEIFHCTSDHCDQIKDYKVNTDVENNKDIHEPSIDLTQSSNSSTPVKDGVYEKYSSFEHSLENSNDSDKTVILKEDSEKVDNIQDDDNSIGRDNISVVYDEVSFEYAASDGYRKKYFGMHFSKESKDEKKMDHSNGGENPVFRIDDNSNSSDKTVILPLEDEKTEMANSYANLGKKGKISIDYHEISIINNADNYNAVRNISKTSHTRKSQESKRNISRSSQNSEFQLNDNEHDYTIHKSKRDNFDFGGLSVLDNLPNIPSFRKTSGNASLNKDNILELKENENDIRVEGTPEKNIDVKQNIKTPENRYIIKFDNVTPMPDYTRMSSPEIIEELDKYGIKPFKRKRAIQLLTHIYNQTHPIIESIEDIPSPAKRMKLDERSYRICRKLLPTPKEALEMLETQDVYEVTNEVPDLKEIDCPVEDWVFQKREKAKIHSCRVPLHIVFHNYVSCRRALRESILRYEPVDIDIIHKQLVAYGHRYDPKELLKFMDKKCITVKTADNKNNKF